MSISRESVLPRMSSRGLVVPLEQVASCSAPSTSTTDGTAALNVTSLALSTPASWITWTPSGAFSIPPGGNRPVTVSVDVAQAGSGGRQLIIQSNDGNESPYPGGVSLVVAGQGIGPEILRDGFENGDFAAWSQAAGN